jgi:hypothetical protein
MSAIDIPGRPDPYTGRAADDGESDPRSLRARIVDLEKLNADLARRLFECHHENQIFRERYGAITVRDVTLRAPSDLRIRLVNVLAESGEVQGTRLATMLDLTLPSTLALIKRNADLVATRRVGRLRLIQLKKGARP